MQADTQRLHAWVQSFQLSYDGEVDGEPMANPMASRMTSRMTVKEGREVIKVGAFYPGLSRRWIPKGNGLDRASHRVFVERGIGWLF